MKTKYTNHVNYASNYNTNYTSDYTSDYVTNYISCIDYVTLENILQMVCYQILVQIQTLGVFIG